MTLKIITNFPTSKITPLFIVTFLLFVNSGFYFNDFPILAPVYIFFYIAIIYFLMKLPSIKHIKIPYHCIYGLILIWYILVSQFFVMGKVIAIFGSIATFLFYIIGTAILPKLGYKRSFFIINAILKFYVIVYGLDTLYRLALINFNISKMFCGLNFYMMKTTTLLYADTNTVGINTTMLALFSLYLCILTKNRNYIVYIVIYTILNILSFSRSSIFAEILTLLLLLVFFILRNFLRRTKYKLPSYCFSVRNFIFFLLLLIIITISIFILILILIYINKDPSFYTKIGAFNTFKTFIRTAPPIDFLFGIGFNNGRLVEYGSTIAKSYAHTYLLTYFVETGFCGYILVTSFLLSILFKTPANMILLIPYSIFGISLIAHTQLHLFYLLLAFIWYFEKLKDKRYYTYKEIV